MGCMEEEQDMTKEDAAKAYVSLVNRLVPRFS